MTRRNFLGTLACGAGGFGYMRFGEAHWLEVNSHQVSLSPNGTSTEARPVRILHLSDFHASPVVSLNYIREAIELGLSLKPDLICLTGDFITSKYDRFDQYASILRKVAAAAPTFACMGNHDGGWWVRRWGYKDWDWVAKMLKSADVTLLHNEARRININGTRLQLVGVGDLWARELDPATAFRETEKNLGTILLSHNPDSKTVVANFAWDLMLCGHTHGGQLKLPIIGTPLAPVRDKRYVAGLKQWQGRWIHTTKGVGNLHGLRFNCRPEVSLLNVTV
jgi:predicted MPP superfamily phosphohydrolase